MIDLIGWVACIITISSIYMPSRLKLHAAAGVGCIFWFIYAASINSTQYMVIESITVISHMVAVTLILKKERGVLKP